MRSTSYEIIVQMIHLVCKGPIRPSSIGTKCILIFVTFIFIIQLLGCGGGGGPQTGSTLQTFTIKWPARSRDALNLRLSSAKSISLFFEGAFQNGLSGRAIINRDPNRPEEHVVIYQLTDIVRTGTHNVLVGAYSEVDAQGSIVGSAFVPIQVDSAVINLGGVELEGRLKSVRVSDTFFTPDSSSKQMMVVGLGDHGVNLLLDTGAAAWTQNSGFDVFSISRDGIVTILGSGTGQVSVTVDDVSTTAMVTVGGTQQPSGTFKVESGPMLISEGVAKASFPASQAPIPIEYEDGNSFETKLENAIVLGPLTSGSRFTLLKSGSQFLKGSYLSTNGRFFNVSGTPIKIPITEEGVLIESVAFPSIGASENNLFQVSFNSQINFQGNIISGFDYICLFQNLISSPQIRRLVKLPTYFKIFIPIEGEPITKTRGSIEYKNAVEGTRVFPRLDYPNVSFGPSNLTLDGDGRRDFGASQIPTLVTGIPKLSIRFQY